MTSHNYYKYYPSFSGEGRKRLLKFLTSNKKLIVEDFYLNSQDAFEGEQIYYLDNEITE